MKNATLKLKLSLLFISILISLSLTFSSCSDSLEDESFPSQKVTLKGTIALSGALPSELVSGSLEADSPSRAAFPTTTGCTYSVTAVCTNPAESVNGTISGNSYSIELTLGRTYTVTAALKNGDSVIFSDDWENVEVTRGNAATLSHDFILKGKSGGSGSIELNITVPSSVKSVKASSSSSVWDSSSPSFTLDSTTATLSCSSINAGTYEVTLDFYDSTDESNRILLYSCTQSINVVENMKTNLWKESSSASSPISNDTFTLTDALITSFERTQIYVGDTSVGTASESGSGSPYAPLATFEKALSIIENQGASNKDYTIWISGNFTGTKTLSSSLDGKAQSITISGTNGNSTDVLDGNNEGTTLTVATAVPVTIKNLKITGGSAENGGGINNSGTLSLSDGCLVAGNTASNFGGGVYSTGTMFMYGSAVIGDSTKTTAATDTTETGCSNKAEYGAGIYSLGNLYLGYSAWTSESDNKPAALTGGVFYNFSHDTGGIYQYANKTFLMNSGFVSYNAGRGIYVGNCSFTMSGGSVSGNTTFEPGNDYQTNGAGIYAGYASTVLISGGTISGNEAGEDGGGLYIAKSNTSVTIEGGTISSNTAGGNGKGIALTFGSLKMQGGAKVDSSNDVYLASGKTVTVTGALESTTTVAKITPSTYTDSVQVLDLATNPTPATTLLSEYKKFEVVPDGSTKYYISSDGKIFSTKPATHFTTVPTNGTTVGLATIDDFKKVAEWVGDSNELSGVTLSLLSDVTLDSSFTPVGDYNGSNVFTGGTFDGNNKTITYDNVSFTQKYSGIFSGAIDATIQNLNLEGTLNVNADYAGCVIGYAEACIIKNCSSSVNITAGSSAKYCLGGIVGKAEGSYISGQKCERNCYILDCVNTSSIIADNGMYIGGIAGGASVCVIRNCINKGNISGVKMCGGIVGSTTLYGSDNYGSLIENCGNNGNITATSDYFSSEGSVGGIAGGPTAGNEEWAPKINNCYSSGTITAQNNKAGGIFGYLKNRCTLSKCYYYNPDQACQDGSPDSGSSKYTDVSNILDDMNSLNNSDSDTYRRWKVSDSGVLEFE